ncbi:MAG: sensor histidine kinase [Frankiales bacterium]|nr:sensor histidine kinase [Frankiales bacterium]
MTRPRSAAPAEARLDDALWRAVSLFRITAFLYAVAVVLASYRNYRDRDAAVLVLAVMAVWTVVMCLRTPTPWPMLSADLLVTVLCQQASSLILTRSQIDAGHPTITVCWAAVPVAAWAVRGGWVWGGTAGLVIATGAVLERQGASQTTVNSCVLLVLLGTVVGYLVQIARRAEAAYAEAVRLRAETAERERLARDVHDGVLQTLALVARRSHDPALVSLATGQEQALRRLVSGPGDTPAGSTDLRGLLPARPGVEVAAPATPVTLPAGVARKLAAAVAAAVDNALQHGGTTAWLLVEDDDCSVTVSVRDDGPGIPAGRLEVALTEGRLGAASSIRGRVEDLGGTVSWVSTSGQGTEVELRVPRG